MKKIKSMLTILLMGLLSLASFSNITNVKASEEGQIDVIASSNESNWFHNEKTENQGVWSVVGNTVEVDAQGTAYSMDGANYLTNAINPLGAYEFSTKINISQVYAVENPMVGIIPWYLDKDNYLYVLIKFTNSQSYLTCQEEINEGYAIDQIIFSGKYNGESKYYTATSQQENTVFEALKVANLTSSKLNPTNELGHTLKVRFEANSATATSYSVSIYYNDVLVGTSSAYYYNAVAKNVAVGYMATDVKATFSNSYINDFYATNRTAALARDWMEKDGYVYRCLNGVDTWEFDEDGNVSINATEIKDGSSTLSNYKVSGSNIAGYDTNRGFMVNKYATSEDGLPQNYSLTSKVKLESLAEYKGKAISQGYGLLAWYKDDHNFIDVTLRHSVSGSKAAPIVSNQVVLSGWIEYSNLTVGENTYDLPEDFDFTVEHTLKVEKKSTGFYVYLDDCNEPIISKSIKGTDINTYYGYEGYNAKFNASKIEVEPIYSSYDEISVLDNNDVAWRVSANSKDAWTFGQDGSIKINAKESSSTLTNRSYLIGSSDISDLNMSVEVKAKIELGSSNYAELMLSPYILDEDNYVRAGLIFEDGKYYAALRSSTYTDDDIDKDLDPEVIVRRYQIGAIDLENDITLRVEKVENTIAIYVNDNLVYGKIIDNIYVKSEDFGVYTYNMDLNIKELNTIGYKIYTKTMVGEWTSVGMKYNEWTIDENGYLAGDATYTSVMEKNDYDGERNYAIKPLGIDDSSYELTVSIKATAQSEAEDRVGVVMWYLDEDNFMIFYLDRWRMDSTVPRTTIYGKVNGETLPTTYNHGGWLKESDALITTEDGRSISVTESSQVTEWHTIKVVKKDNTFTCYIDEATNGYISYTVASGLASSEGKSVYAGIYALNDAVLVRNYQVSAVGEASSTDVLPATAGNPINQYQEPPTLGKYDDEVALDKFDGKINNEHGESPVIDDPDDEDDKKDSSSASEEEKKDSSSSSGEIEPTPEPSKSGCKGSATVSLAMLLMLAIGIYALKKKEN